MQVGKVTGSCRISIKSCGSGSQFGLEKFNKLGTTGWEKSPVKYNKIFENKTQRIREDHTVKNPRITLVWAGQSAQSNGDPQLQIRVVSKIHTWKQRKILNKESKSKQKSKMKQSQILYWPIRYPVTKVKTGRKLIALLQKRPGINRKIFEKISPSS
jgi:hypothetical protein